MKKIINGKKYDTETAKALGGEDTRSLSQTDFRYFWETLYVKKTGEYFLHGQGHGMTKYATRDGLMACWGSAIIPLSVQDAKNWAEKNLDADKFESIFGVVEE